MAKSRTNMQPLLIQIRECPEIAEHERQCYLKRCGFESDHLDWINVSEHTSISWADADHADVIFIGGAGAYSVTKEYEFTRPLRDLVVAAYDRDRPLFGNCWGHQFIAQALGGTVINDMPTSEVGCFDVLLNGNSQNDPVFSGLNRQFPTLMGHHDRIEVMPDNCVELAYSEKCRNQAMRVKGKPIYGTQFHTEMNGDQLIERLTVYADAYLDSDDELDALKQRSLDTPDADKILNTFIDSYV